MAKHLLSRRYLIPGLLLATTTLFLGCTPLEQHAAVLEGNYHYSRGNYQESIVSYLSLLEEPEVDSYVSYNLGNVYQALGEGSAALRMWEEATGSPDEELRFKVSFNRGVFHFERGDYRAAFDEFKEALRVDSGSLPAKINLELTLLRLNAEEQLSDQGGEQSAESEEQVGREALRVLEFVRRKEQQRWEANRQAEQSEFRRDW